MTRNDGPGPQRVCVFFYGTFMSARVLREYGIECEATVPAAVRGYRLDIGPRANLVREVDGTVYGGLAFIRTEEIAALYKSLVENHSLVYEPVEVVAEPLAGGDRSAACYVCAEMEPGDADPAYIDEMSRCCEELALPDEYAAHVRSFAP